MALIAIGRKSDKAKARDEAEKKAAALAALSVASDAIALTEEAAHHVKERLVADGAPDGYFRVGVRGGGCSGLTYEFKVEAEKRERDLLFEAHGARVIVDPKSLKVLGGTVLDYDQALGKSGFSMKNPNAKSACSCGQSFSI